MHQSEVLSSCQPATCCDQQWASGTLPVPIIQPIDMNDVVAVAPEFEDMDLQTVLEELSSRETRSRLIQGLQLTDAQRLSTPSPDSDSATPPSFESTEAIPPTHLLVAHDGLNGPSFAYPCHAVVLASHFAHLPPSPAPYPQPAGTIHRMDVVIPYPAAFDLIREYAYTHSSEALISRLLGLAPGVPRTSEAVFEELQDMEVEELSVRARMVQEVYADATALGLVDKQFWEQIQMASCFVTSALNHAVWRDQMEELEELGERFQPPSEAVPIIIPS
ncbi:hypothetical protein M407DRAFT_240937 [Tulasnella calospora MUT 4182]|uniref:Uncharacterized protein n=1 Tax=Tulasnella calospora MUT 4182 TaxID=1051891 RepID=A0A0C3QXK8_9AGAM|nr:hypothetical protein M407DRAFT_240937 [Tulasnella calospora MUT 4182]